jgi:hypothetical protein
MAGGGLWSDSGGLVLHDVLAITGVKVNAVVGGALNRCRLRQMISKSGPRARGWVLPEVQNAPELVTVSLSAF